MVAFCAQYRVERDVLCGDLCIVGDLGETDQPGKITLAAKNSF
jgi:hypothetical protein